VEHLPDVKGMDRLKCHNRFLPDEFVMHICFRFQRCVTYAVKKASLNTLRNNTNKITRISE
jgi:hypothetical protein